jgi:hypothetical protein
MYKSWFLPAKITASQQVFPVLDMLAVLGGIPSYSGGSEFDLGLATGYPERFYTVLLSHLRHAGIEVFFN